MGARKGPLMTLCHLRDLSYQYLPSHLQWCFAYCSAFPRGYPFDVDKLVNIWIAQGLIQSKNMNKRLEDVGRDHLRDLVSRSYFEIPNYAKSYWQRRYHAMHDLLHELAASVCLDECLIYKGKGVRNLVKENSPLICISLGWT